MNPRAQAMTELLQAHRSIRRLTQRPVHPARDDAFILAQSPALLLEARGFVP